MSDVVKVTVSAARGPASVIPGPAGQSPFTNLRDQGGSPNGVADNSPPLATVIGTAASLIVMAANGAAATYRFNAAWPVASMAGKIIDAPGVVLSHATSAILSGAGGQIQYARVTQHLLRDINATYTSIPQGNLPVGQKTIFLGDKGPDSSRYASVVANDGKAVTPLALPWNTSDTWEADAFTSVNANGYVKTSAAADGKFHVAQRKMLPGDRYFARPSIGSGTPLLVALIRHTGGYVGIMAETNGAPAISLIQKATGSAGTSTPISFFSQTHSSYFPANSEWAIDVESWNTCTVLFNGVVVARFTTTGIIYDAGFGMYPSGTGSSATWNDLVVGADLPPSAAQLLSVAIFGDSRNQPRDACPATFCRNALDLACGVRAYRVDNFAVGGQDSGAQLAIMQAADLSPYNHIHINVGTNDVQGGISLLTFNTNIAAMATLAKANGRTVSFGLFPLWYTQGQAGAGKGQASTNYEKSAPFRSAIRRYCTDNGHKLLDLTRMTGPVIAHYINASLSPNLVGQGDPVVFDNIHFTAYFNRILGEEMARLFLATLFSKKTFYLGPQGIDAKNGWAVTSDQPVVSISSSGFISCRGILNDPGGATKTDGAVIATLPPYARPDKSLRPSAAGSAGRGLLNVAPNGEITIYGMGATTFVDLSDVKFQLPEAA